MIWTRRQITKLQTNSIEAQAQIVRLFERAIIYLGENKCAWGQFLDVTRDNTQYGVYGTSAGIEVLIFGGYKRDHEIISKAINLFTESFTDPVSRFCKKGDVINNYKMAFWIESIEPDKKEVDEKNPLMEELIKRKIVGQGWGDYYISRDNHDLNPKVLATACILFALRRYRPFESTKECEESLNWLCKRLLENGSLTIYEFAISALALLEYGNLAIKVLQYKEAVKQVTARLVDWGKRQKKSEFESSMMYHYCVAMNGDKENKYLFFLPDCLVSLALLRRGCPADICSYVLNVVQYYTGSMLSKGGYAPRSTGRLSSIDHLWIFRLLSEFEKTSSVSLVTPKITKLLEAPWFIQVIVALLFLCLGIWGLYVGLLVSNQQNNSQLLRILSGIAATIGLGIFGRFLWKLIARGEK
jgi:hypothetical protein